MEEVVSLGPYRTERPPPRLHPYVRSSNRRAISLDEDALKRVTEIEEAEEELVEAAALGTFKSDRPASAGASPTPGTTEGVPRRNTTDSVESDSLTRQSSSACLSSSVAPPPKLKGLPMMHSGVSDLFGDATLSVADLSAAESDETAFHNKAAVGNAANPQQQQQQQQQATAATGGQTGVLAPSALLPPPLAKSASSGASPLLATRSKGEALVQAALTGLTVGIHRDAAGCARALLVPRSHAQFLHTHHSSAALPALCASAAPALLASPSPSPRSATCSPSHATPPVRPLPPYPSPLASHIAFLNLYHLPAAPGAKQKIQIKRMKDQHLPFRTQHGRHQAPTV